MLDERKKSFINELIYLLSLYDIEIDHNHDPEALSNGWHFISKDKSFIVRMHEIFTMTHKE